MEIVAEVEVNEAKEEFTDFFWLVRKSLKIYEGEKECIGSGRQENCYDASRRRRLRRQDNNGLTKYELILDVDRLDREDLESKIYLVKDFREFNSKMDEFEIIVVPGQRQTRALEEEEAAIEDFSSRERQKLSDRQGCLIRKEVVDVGDSVRFPELCVSLTCNKEGNVDVRSMEESQCRRRRQSRKNEE